MKFGKSRKNGKKSKKSRTTVCIIITAAIFAGFAIRLVDWQLVQGKSYKSLAAKSTGYTEKTDATRGEIVDRNGVGLVVNTTKYKIVLNKLYIEEDRLDGILLELADILTKTGDARTDSLPISVGSDGSCVYKTSREEDAEKLLTGFTNDTRSLEATVSELVDLMILGGFIHGGTDNVVMISVRDLAANEEKVLKV